MVNEVSRGEIPSDKDLVDIITEEVKSILEEGDYSKNLKGDSNQFLYKYIQKYPKIPLGVSNRHIHLKRETFQILFGNNSDFESMRQLYQPGEFASKYVLTIVGPKLKSIPNVRILGPLRRYDQVEVSLTDAIFLGIDPPVTNSGTLDKAAPLTLVGPNCSVFLEKCAIIANRHIHMSPKEAEQFNIKNGEYCSVRITGEKSTVFENVLVRVNENWKLQIHLDTDDANAANVREDTTVEFLGKM